MFSKVINTKVVQVQHYVITTHGNLIITIQSTKHDTWRVYVLSSSCSTLTSLVNLQFGISLRAREQHVAHSYVANCDDSVCNTDETAACPSDVRVALMEAGIRSVLHQQWLIRPMTARRLSIGA